MSIQSHGVFFTPGANSPAAPPPSPCTGTSGRHLRAAPLGSAHGTSFPRAHPSASCPPADPSATVQDLRHAIITNLEQSQDAWPPACPPLEPAR